MSQNTIRILLLLCSTLHCTTEKKLRSLDPIHCIILQTLRKQSILTHLYNRVFFPNHTHQTYKEIQIKKHVNSKPKVPSNTVFHISRFWTMDIHSKRERLSL